MCVVTDLDNTRACVKWMEESKANTRTVQVCVHRIEGSRYRVVIWKGFGKFFAKILRNGTLPLSSKGTENEFSVIDQKEDRTGSPSGRMDTVVGVGWVTDKYCENSNCKSYCASRTNWSSTLGAATDLRCGHVPLAGCWFVYIIQCTT